MFRTKKCVVQPEASPLWTVPGTRYCAPWNLICPVLGWRTVLKILDHEFFNEPATADLSCIRFSLGGVRQWHGNALRGASAFRKVGFHIKMVSTVETRPCAIPWPFGGGTRWMEFQAGRQSVLRILELAARYRLQRSISMEVWLKSAVQSGRDRCGSRSVLPIRHLLGPIRSCPPPSDGHRHDAVHFEPCGLSPAPRRPFLVRL